MDRPFSLLAVISTGGCTSNRVPLSAAACDEAAFGARVLLLAAKTRAGAAVAVEVEVRLGSPPLAPETADLRVGVDGGTDPVGMAVACDVLTLRSGRLLWEARE